MHCLKINKTLFVGLFFCLALSLFGQAVESQLLSPTGQPMPSAAVISAQQKVYFSDSTGLIRVNSATLHYPYLIVAQGYNAIYINQPTAFTPQIKLSKNLAPFAGDSTALLDTLVARASSWAPRLKSYQSLTYEQHTAHIEKILFHLWPISGLALPANYHLGKVYAAEELKKNNYKDRFAFNEEVLAKKEAGKITAENWFHLPDYSVALWQERSFFNNVINRGFYGPLHKNGQAFYHYKIEGYYNLGPYKVYKVAFKPATAGKPLFSGTAHILAETGLPLQTNFGPSQNSPIETYDSVSIKQLFGFNPKHYFLTKQENYFAANHVGFAYNYQLNQFHLHFSYQSQLPSFNELSIYQIEKSDFAADSTLWDSLTPPKLEPYDSAFYKENSLALAPPKWRFYKGSRLHRTVLNYYNWTYKSHMIEGRPLFVKIPAAYRAIGYNAIEGPYFNYDLPFGLTYSNKEFQITPTLRYGLADKVLKPSVSISYRFNPYHPQEISFTAGQTYQQFNPDNPVLPIINTIYGLGLGENLMRLYGKNLARLNYGVEVANGLSVTTFLEYSQRFPLFNNTNFNLLNPDNEFAPNNPDFENVINQNGFTPHEALTFNLELGYQFGQLYESRYSLRHDNKLGYKQNLIVQKPRVYYNMRLGIPTAFGETNYWFQSLGIHQAFRWANLGVSQYDISVGHFPIRESVPFVDFKHFDGIQVFFLQPTPSPKNRIKQFSTLPYYGFSTNNAYAEVHYEHFFEGALLNKIPLLQSTGVHSLVGFNALAMADDRYFGEVYFGLNNIFDILRVEYSVGYSSNNELLQNVRIGFDFNYRYYTNNRPEKRPAN